LQVNCKDKDEWFVFKEDSLQYGECKKNPCLNKTLLDSELGTSVSNETIMFYMLGLHENDPNNRMPYKPFWFLNTTSENGQCMRTFARNGCGKDEMLIFYGTDHQPICRLIPSVLYPFGCGSSGLSSSENNCPPNYIKVGNDCVKTPTKKLNFKPAEDDDE
jgi:hypothetical protein